MHTPENALLTDLYFYTYFINMYTCISSYLIAIVKIKETSFKMESGSPEGDSLPLHYHSLPLADPSRKKCTLYFQTDKKFTHS